MNPLYLFSHQKRSLQQYAEIRRNTQKHPIKNPKQKHQAKTFFALDFSVRKNTQADLRKGMAQMKTHLIEPQGIIKKLCSLLPVLRWHK